MLEIHILENKFYGILIFV